jgi:hypothetical protein
MSLSHYAATPPYGIPHEASPLDDERKFVAYYGIRPSWAALLPTLYHCRPCAGTGGDEYKGACPECRGVGLVKRAPSY